MDPSITPPNANDETETLAPSAQTELEAGQEQSAADEAAREPRSHNGGNPHEEQSAADEAAREPRSYNGGNPHEEQSVADEAAREPRSYDDGNPPGIVIKEQDWVILLTSDGKRFTVRAGQGSKGTHFGEVNLKALVGMEYGRATHTNIGHPIYLLRPTLQDQVMTLKRITQIIYPKDLGTILMKLGIGEGSRVLECGTGSGALTVTMAWVIGNTGKIYSYDREKAHSDRARYNLNRLGLLDRVELKLRDLAEEDFDERGVDAAFLDVREPPDILHKITAALSPGGVLGVLVPTANQVSALLKSLEDAPYIGTEVLETYFRRYKVNAERFRPEDRMIGHTGYLIFTRRIVPVPPYVPPETTESNETEPGTEAEELKEGEAPEA